MLRFGCLMLTDEHPVISWCTVGMNNAFKDACKFCHETLVCSSVPQSVGCFPFPLFSQNALKGGVNETRVVLKMLKWGRHWGWALLCDTHISPDSGTTASATGSVQHDDGHAGCDQRSMSPGPDLWQSLIGHAVRTVSYQRSPYWGPERTEYFWKILD